MNTVGEQEQSEGHEGARERGRWEDERRVTSALATNSVPHVMQGENTWAEYAQSAALVTAILLVVCCCCCCCLCIYICKLNTRLDHDVPWSCCIPGSPPESWATSTTMKMAAWLILLACGVAWFILIILSFTYNTQLSNSVRNIPDILIRCESAPPL